MSDKTYLVNEVFYSVQGEGMRAGEASVFVRFAGCNLRCNEEEHGFDCDTEFTSGRKVTATELNDWIIEAIKIAAGDSVPLWYGKKMWIVFTGGEPALQLTKELCDYLHERWFLLAVETNGTKELPKKDELPAPDLLLTLANYYVDWITVSPKTADHTLKQLWAHEVKYVRGYGQALPKTPVKALHKLISPAFDGLRVHPKTLEWCNKLVLENPEWRLSVQHHKLWAVR